MKFLVDEQLPFPLVKWLRANGFDAIHASSLGKGTRIPDSQINQQSMVENRVVISKDVDFFNTFLLKKEPFKLLYLTTGNIKNADLLALFEANFEKIQSLLSEFDVVEMNHRQLRPRL